VERVRRDEERAAALEEGDRVKVMQADSEARIALLRKRAKKGKSKEEDQAEKALERQLQNKGRHEEPKPEGNGAEGGRSITRVAASQDTHVNITTADGHCESLACRPFSTSSDRYFVVNFFADLEGGVPSASTLRQSKRNAEYEAEKKAEQEKWDRQITMYLEAPPKTWYDSQDGLNDKERKRTEDQRLEKAYKDNEHKRVEDPLATMQAYLQRRDEVKAAERRHQANPWDDTPRTLKSDRTPVATSRLAQRKGSSYRRSPSPSRDIEEGPQKPPRLGESVPAEEIARKREMSERERAKALLASRRRDAASVNSTPRSEFGYETGMYNRAATREAKSYSNPRYSRA
jgi:hypothetical protein